MGDRKKIKLIKYRELFSENTLLIGESIDWGAMGNKAKRAELRSKGVEISLVKKSYMSYFFKDLGVFKGNIIVISMKKELDSAGLLKVVNELEVSLGILPLFLISNKRVMGMGYLKSLIKEGVTKEDLSSLLARSLKGNINSLNLVNKNLIKVISKVK